jgi:hypothetical protein
MQASNLRLLRTNVLCKLFDGLRPTAFHAEEKHNLHDGSTKKKTPNQTSISILKIH